MPLVGEAPTGEIVLEIADAGADVSTKLVRPSEPLEMVLSTP